MDKLKDETTNFIKALKSRCFKPKGDFNHYLLIIVVFIVNQFYVTEIAIADYIIDNDGMEELVLSLNINYVQTDIISTTIKTHNNNLLLPFEDIESYNIRPEFLQKGRATIDGIEYINLNKLPYTDYSIDYANLILIVKFPAAAMPTQNMNVWYKTHYDPLSEYKSTPIKSFFVNYDLTITREDKSIYAIGVEELNYSTSESVISQTLITRKSFYDKDYHPVTRLSTSWTSDNEANMSQWRIGDSITNAADWSSSTRFAGIQYSTDFSLRPDLVTYPLMSFSGRADLPSALDIYANSQLIYRTELNAGEFNMTNLPINAGRGALEVKQQDITGKLQTISIPYYIAPNLLKEGLEDYSYAIGTQRIGYGTYNNKYRYLVTSFDYMKGMSDTWTSGIHFESMKNVFAFGATSLYKVGNSGVLSASLASSGPKTQNAQKAIIGYSFQRSDFSINLQQTASGKNFLNVFNLDNSGLVKSTRGSITYSFNTKSSISIGFLDAVSRNFKEKTKVQNISASYQNSLTKNSFLRLSAGTDVRNKGNAFVSLSLGMLLGNNYVNSSISRQDRDIRGQLSMASSSRNYNDTTYRVNVNRDNKFTTYDVEIEKSMSQVDASFYYFKYGDRPTQQVNLNGAIVSTAYGTFFTNTIDNSFAIAKVAKFSDVGVYNNNQFITKTNKNGIAFIPNVPSYFDSTIRLDELNLPLSAQFKDSSMTVRAKRKSGVIADFDITKVHAAEMMLIDTNGKKILTNLDVQIDGIEEDLFVGYNGKVYIPNIKVLKHLSGKACNNNECCQFNISIEGMENIEIIDLGEQLCY
jgi:outer membrane usher protein FimD/PapC